MVMDPKKVLLAFILLIGQQLLMAVICFLYGVTKMPLDLKVLITLFVANSFGVREFIRCK